MNQQTIDMTPTWQAILPLLTHAVRNGTPEALRVAEDELQRMAKGADLAHNLINLIRSRSQAARECGDIGDSIVLGRLLEGLEP
jgi:hypothetical protein